MFLLLLNLVALEVAGEAGAGPAQHPAAHKVHDTYRARFLYYMVAHLTLRTNDENKVFFREKDRI